MQFFDWLFKRTFYLSFHKRKQNDPKAGPILLCSFLVWSDMMAVANFWTLEWKIKAISSIMIGTFLVIQLFFMLVYTKDRTLSILRSRKYVTTGSKVLYGFYLFLTLGGLIFSFWWNLF